MKKYAIYVPGLIFVSVLHENGTVSDQYESNSCLSQAGLSSLLGRSHVNA